VTRGPTYLGQVRGDEAGGAWFTYVLRRSLALRKHLDRAIRRRIEPRLQRTVFSADSVAVRVLILLAYRWMESWRGNMERIAKGILAIFSTGLAFASTIRV
jgi:hypothetical protein